MRLSTLPGQECALIVLSIKIIFQLYLSGFLPLVLAFSLDVTGPGKTFLE